MSDDLRTLRPPRARPVAEAPVDALLERVDELAKRWVIALIQMRPLERIGEIPLQDLAREAPALCAHALSALASDAGLERTIGRRPAGGDAPRASVDFAAAARRLGALAGAHDPATAVEAVEALRGVLWEALMDELRWPTFDRSPARLVADLADRLAYICARALDATIEGTFAGEPDRLAGEAEPALAGAEGARHGPRDLASPRRGTILVDEREDILRDAPRALDPQQPRALNPQQPRARPLPWEMPAPDSPMPAGSQTESSRSETYGLGDRTEPSPPVAERAGATAAHGGVRESRPSFGPRIEITDKRGEQGPAAWIGSIGAQLERFERDGLPFAVLLVELGGERQHRGELPGELHDLAGLVEGALVNELRPIGARPAGSLTRERPGRYWLLAPHTNGIGARALAERLSRAVTALASSLGARVDVAVGTAVCPEDGRGAAALAAHADIALFAARADARASSGRPGARVDESA